MKVKTWELPSDLLSQSVSAMRPHGRKGNEGLGLWFGQESADTVAITHLIAPRGPGLVSHPLHLSLSMRAMSRITRLSDELDCYWVGQIHSHPGTMVSLSMVDCQMGVHVQDYLSVVCPHYAQRDIGSILECGVHLFDGGMYRAVSPWEVRTRIAISARNVNVVSLEVAA